jgi:membrane protein
VGFVRTGRSPAAPRRVILVNVKLPRLRPSAIVERVDRWQQRRPVPALLVGIAKRYVDDQGRRFGALLSYYGFMSLFPLLLVLVTVLGFVLQDDPDLVDRILDTVYARIPVIGAMLREDAASLEASGPALVFGLLLSLWSGLGVVRVASDAVNLQWGVPRYRRQRFVARQVRALGGLLVLGLGIVLATAATNLAAFLPDLPMGERIAAGLAAVAVNVAVLAASYRVLVQAPIGWRELVPGALAGGVVLWILQLVGGTYVANVILGASDVFGVFAATFGLLVWIALVARTTLLANEINVVRAKRLWPRGLRPDHPTEADQRNYDEVMNREALTSLP